MKNFIAKEGYLSISLVFVLLVLVWFFWSFSFILFFLLLFLLFLFRISKREGVCNDKAALLAPIDGKIVSIENCVHKDLGECIKISIKNAFYDCGILSAPLQMQVVQIRAKHGLFLCSELECSKRLNERVFILAKAAEQDIALRICAGSLDRNLKLDDFTYELKSGDKMGFLLNGKVHLFVPQSSRIHAGVGDYVRLGSLLGYLGKA